MSIDEKSIADANSKFVSTYNKDDYPSGAPKRKLAILTCMDTWIHANDMFGVNPGDAHIIRNAGASAKEGLRSLVISQQLLGTNEIWLLKHTRCGMAGLTNERVHQTIKENLGVQTDMDFLPFEELKQAVIDDVEWLRKHELIPEATRNNIRGYIIHLGENGRLERIL